MSTAAQPQLWQLPLATDATPLQTLRCLCRYAVLMRRGINDLDQAKQWLTPSALPPADEHFPGLQPAVTRLIAACQSCETLAICGDYDADGMTSTALLIRALQPLGARPVAAIPSRMDDGYGLNVRMVEELHQQGVRLLVTVDNGVAAEAALARAKDLDVEVIITDHHTIPDPPPQALALLHPATTPVDSPYRGLAGVGLAYVLARSLAEALEKPEAIASARDLFCIGTIADMAPLTGANRAWLREGLDHLHRTRCAGLRALQQLSGLEDRALRADDVRFQIAPGSMPTVDWENPLLWWIFSPKTTPIPQLSWPGSVMGSTVSGVSSATPSKRKPSPWWNPTPSRSHLFFSWHKAIGTTG